MTTYRRITPAKCHETDCLNEATTKAVVTKNQAAGDITVKLHFDLAYSPKKGDDLAVCAEHLVATVASLTRVLALTDREFTP